MDYAKPLPSYLVKRYQGWKATQFSDNKAWYKRLASEGQHPRAMVISCCDSRVHVTSIFGADTGEFFIHRNIANLVPPYTQDGDHHGTSAAVEFAVCALKVAHIIVVGHSNCGGVNGCHDMCRGQAPVRQQASSFVDRWMELLRPGFERVKDIENTAERITALEHEGIKISLENLMSFPFVQGSVQDETLTLHGLWHDIASGSVEVFDGNKDRFSTI